MAALRPSLTHCDYPTLSELPNPNPSRRTAPLARCLRPDRPTVGPGCRGRCAFHARETEAEVRRREGRERGREGRGKLVDRYSSCYTACRSPEAEPVAPDAALTVYNTYEYTELSDSDSGRRCSRQCHSRAERCLFLMKIQHHVKDDSGPTNVRFSLTRRSRERYETWPKCGRNHVRSEQEPCSPTS